MWLCAQIFDIRIIALTMSVSLYNEVRIVQSYAVAAITNETLSLETNGNRSSLLYNVTEAPYYGKLMVDQTEVSTFSQADVDAGRLFYFQHDMTSAFDEFHLDVRDAVGNVIRGVEVQVLFQTTFLNVF